MQEDDDWRIPLADLAGQLHLSGAITTLRRRMKKFVLLALAALILSCDHGLAPPPPVEPGFGGTIYFEKGTWPALDSLVNLWVFASQVFPLDSEKIFQALLSDPPKIYLYPGIDKSLPLFVDSISFSFNLPPATYFYVGVLQRVASDIDVRNLKVVGVYGTSDVPPLPIPVVVSEGDFLAGVNIRVNFRKPPPQPF
jgi:hypothetical protein